MLGLGHLTRISCSQPTLPSSPSNIIKMIIPILLASVEFRFLRWNKYWEKKDESLRSVFIPLGRMCCQCQETMNTNNLSRRIDGCISFSYRDMVWTSERPPPCSDNAWTLAVLLYGVPYYFNNIWWTLPDSQVSKALYVRQSLFRSESLCFISFSTSQPSHPNPRNKKLWENSIQMAKALYLSYISVILNCVRYIKLYVKQKLVLKSEHLDKATCD